MATVVFELFGRPVTVGTLLIPVFAAIIGWGTNWVAIQMMFLPIKWWGPRLPFRLGFGKYKIPLLGWQGVIPSKAAKMGSIAVDTGLAKLGTMHEFYKELDPEVMAAHVAKAARKDIHELVDKILAEEYYDIWSVAPAQIKQMVHQRVDAQLPYIIARVMTEIGENIDRLLDLKLMVIRHLESDPRLLNKIFQDVGYKEFRMIVNSGLWLGFLLGIGPMFLWIIYPAPWTVAIGGAAVGYLTNWIALKIIFQPLEPTRFGPLKLHGLFLRRQPEVAEAYSTIIAFQIVTLTNVAQQMIHGPDGDRTRRLIADTVGPVVDEAIGVARPLVRAATAGRYGAIKESVALAAVDRGLETLLDDSFSQDRATRLQNLLDDSFSQDRATRLQNLLEVRMKAMSYPDFAAMLRSAFEQDEWLLILVGALLGLAAGTGQVMLTL